MLKAVVPCFDHPVEEGPQVTKQVMGLVRRTAINNLLDGIDDIAPLNGSYGAPLPSAGELTPHFLSDDMATPLPWQDPLDVLVHDAVERISTSAHLRATPRIVLLSWVFRVLDQVDPVAGLLACLFQAK